MQETLRFVLSNNHQGCLWLPSGRRRPPQFSSDATINGCGVGVGHEYLGYNRQYLAAFIPNLNVFTVNLHFANMAKWGKYSGAHAPGCHSPSPCLPRTVTNPQIEWLRFQLRPRLGMFRLGMFSPRQLGPQFEYRRSHQANFVGVSSQLGLEKTIVQLQIL